MTLIVGIAGNIGSGKDTLGETLVNYDSYLFKIYKAANRIKDQVACFLGFYKENKSHRKMFEDREWKENSVVLDMTKYGGRTFTPRQLCQLFGTDMYRNVLDDSIWTHLLEQDILEDEHPCALITDVRFPTEVALIKKHKGVLIYIERSDNPYAVNTNHESESHVDYAMKTADYKILNHYDTREEFESFVLKGVFPMLQLMATTND